jgi:UrcA family protein
MNSNAKCLDHTKVAYIVAAWVACVLVAVNARASDSPPSETVKFADLNLSTQTGVETLYKRIHAAGARVCQQPAGEQAAVRRCVREAESEAVRKVNEPLLTAYYQQKTGDKSPQALTAKR